MDDRDLPDDVPVVRMVDPALTAGMSEYVVYWTLYHHRKFGQYARQAAEKRWLPLPQKGPRQCRVGIMGLGVMGADAARKLRALDFDVAGWSRNLKSLPGVPGFQGGEGLRDFLARTDILVCLLPLTPDTRAILNAETFRRLPRGAVVINASRGGHLVDDDLLKALESGQLSAAVLDVFHAEPLAADHPFWTHPRIDVTPHVASLTVPESAAKAVVQNIRRMRLGEPPEPIVDPALGY
jgi:glyoxylate/hydroxypyruvate reductase A